MKKVKLPVVNFIRGSMEKWTSYMLNNPFYFETMMSKSFSIEAVRKEAEYQFELVKCPCCGEVVARIRSFPAG